LAHFVSAVDTWNCQPKHPEIPGRLVFDLDPGPNVAFSAVVEAAKKMQSGSTNSASPASARQRAAKGCMSSHRPFQEKQADLAGGKGFRPRSLHSNGERESAALYREHGQEAARRAHLPRLSPHFGSSRDTIAKMCRYFAPPGYVRSKPERPNLGPLVLIIDAILEADKAAPAKQRHTAKRIFERLRIEHSFAGGYTAVKNYVRLARTGHARCSCRSLTRQDMPKSISANVSRSSTRLAAR
jgi:hypothetical protein